MCLACHLKILPAQIRRLSVWLSQAKGGKQISCRLVDSENSAEYKLSKRLSIFDILIY